MEFDSRSLALSASLPSILSRLEAIVGAKHVIADTSSMEGFLHEPRGRFHGQAFCVVHPHKVKSFGGGSDYIQY